ncbi:MAG: MBL fold metallo-hydrolase [Desulfopila sp.]|jgi:2,4-dienoyl-CoA reductase (NADPH2)|nr:MBL fold metallo-hydrolase [Desulfopila sp.]
MVIEQHTINTPYMVGPVHCYTTEVDGELILFDTGPPTAAAQKYLSENLDLTRLRYVFVTHCHVDHYGLAHWLEQNSGARLFLPYRDGLKILSHEERLQDMYELLKRLGFSGIYLEKLHNSLSDGKVFPLFPKTFKIVEDDMPTHLGIGFHSCPGHSQSDIVYYSRDWAVTGDVLLRGVFQSPLLDTDLETGERFRNYEAYCSTLLKLATLREKQICPGHRISIDGVDKTILFYITKMLDRAGQLARFEGCQDENVAGIITAIFGESLEPFHIYLKTSEILFMQDFLKDPERLKNSLEKTGLFHEVAQLYDQAVSA